MKLVIVMLIKEKKLHKMLYKFFKMRVFYVNPLKKIWAIHKVPKIFSIKIKVRINWVKTKHKNYSKMYQKIQNYQIDNQNQD